MKTILSIIYFITFSCVISCGHAQDNTSEEHIITMIKEFYLANSNIWSIPTNEISPNTFNKKLDSLLEKFCTPSIRVDAKRYLNNGGYDFITNEKGSIIVSPETISISKFPPQPNTYKVSYISIDFDASGKQIQKKVVLYVKVVNIDGNYKISAIY